MNKYIDNFIPLLHKKYDINMTNKGTKYQLQSIDSGNIFEDQGWTLAAPGESKPTLIRALYEKKQIEVKDSSYGIYRFSDWLPITRTLEGSSAPVTYKSEGLAKDLGLSNLYITFSGYWPEKNANMPTCSFKETEAYAVCGRMNGEQKGIMVVASAGNTARAFARVCSDNKIPLLLCVPEDNIEEALWFHKPIDSKYVKLVASKGSDYSDAIHLSNIASEMEEFFPEGGAKNVARRDGMATTMLSATTTIGKIPNYYFQGVGSGTGAIAAWEANLRLIEDGRFGSNKMKLLVSQNLPFKPLQDAWRADSRHLLIEDDNEARQQVDEILAKVLSNRTPPYGPVGGLYDALKDTDGDVLTASNEETIAAGKRFEDLEGIDIHPAAAVAVASLIQAVKDNTIEKDAIVMMNITGGGENLFKSQHELYRMKPLMSFPINPNGEEVKKELKKLI